MSGKRNHLDKSNKNFTNPNEPSVEKPRLVKKKVVTEEAPHTVDGIIKKLDKSFIVSRLQVKIPSPLLQRPK